MLVRHVEDFLRACEVLLEPDEKDGPKEAEIRFIVSSAHAQIQDVMEA